MTLGVEDYLMAFKKSGNQEAVKQFLDLYYQPENITRWIAAEGFLPVTKSGCQQMSGNAKLKPYLDALPSARLAPTTDPAWDRVKLDVQQNIGAGRPARRQSQAGARPAAEERRRRGGEPLTAGLAGSRARRGAGRWQALLWLGPSLVAHRGGRALSSRRARSRLARAATPITGLYQGSVGARQLRAAPRAGGAADRGGATPWSGWWRSCA